MRILDDLKHLYDSRTDEVNAWLTHQRQQTPPYIYNSVDLRHSGTRLVPVDVNMFPAGFNNLSPAADKRAAEYFKKYLAANYPDTQRVLVIAESHTRNLSYLQNLFVLQQLLSQAGLEVCIGSLQAEAGSPLQLTTSQQETITQHALVKESGRLQTDHGFIPDIILLNNDMTGGIPELLQAVSQPVLPPLELGWHRRKKSVHFTAYQRLANAFGQAFSIDPWLICAGFHACGLIDFKQREGLDCLAESIDELMTQTRKKYQQYGINQEPYVYVKADSGTYGMGIMTVNSPDDILQMNKKERNKMHKIKEGAQVSEVILQEGIPTIDTVQGKPAEPMVYLVGGCPAGGMYRVNSARNSLNNLNAAGMEFTGMCDQVEVLPDKQTVKDCDFRSYGLVASLSALAAAREDYDITRPAHKDCQQQANSQ